MVSYYIKLFCQSKASVVSLLTVPFVFVDDDGASASSNRPISHTSSVESLPARSLGASEAETASVPENNENYKDMNANHDEFSDDTVSNCSKDTSVDFNKANKRVYYRYENHAYLLENYMNSFT